MNQFLVLEGLKLFSQSVKYYCTVHCPREGLQCACAYYDVTEMQCTIGEPWENSLTYNSTVTGQD